MLYPWQPLSIRLLGGELAQVLKVFVGLQTCRDKVAMSDSGWEGPGGEPRVATHLCSGGCRAR